MPAGHEYRPDHLHNISASQMSLPDQLRNNPHEHATRSMTFLPATTYSASRGDIASASDSIASPDSFYRQYHNQNAQQAGASLRQGALRTTDLESESLNGDGRYVLSMGDRRAIFRNGASVNEAEPSHSHQNSPGLRGRKSSVKNLVAQINASSTEDLPPLPVNGSRNVSPHVGSDMQFQQLNIPRQMFSPIGASLASNHGSRDNQNMSHSRRPLFGEVLPTTSRSLGAGYGIQTLRKRSGSEGSPLHSPNMRPPETESASRTNYDTVTTTGDQFTLSPAYYVAPKQQLHHKRANSESPMTPTRQRFAESSLPDHSWASSQAKTHGSSSRIPVSIRRGSMSSEVDGRTPTPATFSRSVSSLASSEQAKLFTSRRQRSPPQIQSPGQRGKKSVSQGPKSPSLRANIIVPPPKISPPLRSSRPRLPVSSASTAASRSKMAEKIGALQKMNDERRQAARKAGKPPELSDIDLKARRLRITQALSRSLEGQDLKGHSRPYRGRGLSSSRTASPTPSDRSRGNELSEAREGVPAVIVDSAFTNGTESSDITPVGGLRRQERAFSHSAVNATQGTTEIVSAGDDSPTLGPSDLYLPNKPALLLTDVQRVDRSNEPSSAITEGTVFDTEPQDVSQRDGSAQSILNQINRMRSSDLLPGAPDDGLSDRTDQESVRIFLRDTTYLDDDEAIRTGYRPAPAFPHAVQQSAGSEHDPRSSWISSIEDSEAERESDHLHEQDQDTGFARLSNDVAHASPEDEHFISSPHDRFNSGGTNNSTVSRAASDAYTIVNIVLQQHSSSGVVDQQFVDDVYQRILEDSSYGAEHNLSADRIEQICLQEIQDREETWYKSSNERTSSVEQQPVRMDNDADATTGKVALPESEQRINSWLMPQPEGQNLAPPPFMKGHKYKSSLDSAEDWANTSPSVSDWMRYTADEENQKLKDQRSAPSVEVVKTSTRSTQPDTTEKTQQQQDENVGSEKEDDDLYSAPQQRPPSRALPALPAEPAPSSDQLSFGTAIVQRPQIPRRVTSISQISRGSPRGYQSPSVSAPALGKVSTEEAITPEQRRMKQRRNVIKELVDTEFTYEKDLRVLCDIYKQTASAALGDEDIRVLFGNIEEVQVFSKDFLMLLKSLAKPTYTMERSDRKKDKVQEKVEPFVRPRSSSSTLASTKANENELPTPEKDSETRIGQAFEASLIDMEKVYTEYIKNRHAANLRLEALSKSPSAREWLKECKENSSDITNAWNLDALLVKPVQRITKYPLLLKELVDSTAEDHPDLLFLRRALHEITEVNIRINDVKKQAEIMDQVFNRKRKDSDVRAGLSKAFGRRAEKLKQHVGITELYEDAKYNEIKIHYDNNIVQLMVVSNDCSSYGRAITKWVNKMVEIASAAEAWVDVGHSNHQEAESKLRQFAMVVRGISTIALPDHLEQLNNRVLAPMQQAVDLMTKFKTDPKGLLLKREKRMIDYAQIKSKKDRGERIDRKMIERMEQSEALNTEAKQRMRKLITSTAKLVQACQANLVQMQISWQGMVRQKLSAAMGISLEHLNVEDIEKEWQLDFDFHEASALALGICNGSLLAEAVNMVNFQVSATTLSGEESPRQASFTSTSKRSISLASENSYPPIPEYDPRTSATYGHQYHEYSIPYANPRARAQSTTSGKYPRTPDIQQQGSAGEGASTYRRHDTSLPAPRLSVETPSPLIGVLHPEPSSRRPTSSSTFFSASGTPPLPPQPHQSTGSSIFSSAMPMSDSPVAERFSEANAPPDPDVLFTAASVYEFNIDRSRREAGFPYLTYVTGEIFDVIGERGELWLAKNQDDPQRQIGWIWNKHFAKLAE